MTRMCRNIQQHKVYIKKILKFKVLIPFSHYLMKLFHWKFNRRFHDVPDLAPLRNFPKIVPVFLLIFERKQERFEVGSGVKWFFEFNFFPIDVVLKKWGKFFFLRNRKQLRSNILVKVVSLYLPLNYMVKIVCPHIMA
jgi:hypothetical protein